LYKPELAIELDVFNQNSFLIFSASDIRNVVWEKGIGFYFLGG